MKTVNANELLKALDFASVDGDFAPDARRVLNQQATLVRAAEQGLEEYRKTWTRSVAHLSPTQRKDVHIEQDDEYIGHQQSIAAKVAKAAETARMWGVEI